MIQDTNATGKARPPRRRPRRRSMPPQKEVDLTGFYRFDMKTIVLLLALAAQWWDGRAQANQEAALQQLRDEQTQATLKEMKALQNLQRLDMESVRIALAEAGIKVKGD